MLNEAVWRLNQAQALFDVFEQDRGRPPHDLKEIRNWLSIQDREQVELRVKQRLLELLSDNPNLQPKPDTRFRSPPCGWRVLRGTRKGRRMTRLTAYPDMLRHLRQLLAVYLRMANGAILRKP